MKSIILLFALISLIFIGNSISAQDFAWANSMGGNGNDLGKSISVDSDGNVYSGGWFAQTADFDPGSGTYNLSSNGSFDGYITKLDNSGNFLWAKSFGSNSDDRVYGIANDMNNNVYVVGYFANTMSFNTSSGVFNLSSHGNFDIFMAKYTSSGTFLWAKNMGGSSDERGVALQVDSLGNIYYTGWFHGTVDFDPGPSSYNLSTSIAETYISKLDSSGNFIWAKKLNGNLQNLPSGIDIDDQLNVYVTGSFGGTSDFDPGSSVYNLNSSGAIDIFILKLNPNGNFIWAKNLSGPDYEKGNAITVDKFGGVYTIGYFNGTVDFDPGPMTYNLSSMGNKDIFLSKLDNNGGFVWAKRIGGSGADEGQHIETDQYGNTYYTGYYSNTIDIDPGTAVKNRSTNGNDDFFVLKLDDLGNYVWDISLGSVSLDQPHALEIDQHNNVYVTGKYGNTMDFDPSNNTYNLSPTSLTQDIFVAKYTQCSNTSEVISETVCDSYTSPSGKYVWTSNGTYYDTIMNSQGCDSNLVIGLQVNKSTNNVMFRSSCYSYTSPSGKYTWTTSGTYTDTILNTLGCDSSLIIGLIINQRTNSTINETICNSNSYTSPSGKYIWTTSGTYMDTIPNHKGCDSVLTINLQFGSQQSVTLNENACNSYTSPSGKYNWTSSGTYHDTIVVTNGCDTNYVINLSINTVDTAVSNNAMTLTANAVGAIYQWVDCNNNYSPLSGKTHQSYTASSNGTYAVIINQNGCVDTSACHVVMNIGLDDLKTENKTTIYPNPTTGTISVKAKNAVEIKILNISGQLVYQSPMQDNIEKMDISSLSNGVYFVQITYYDKSTETKKIVLNK